MFGTIRKHQKWLWAIIITLTIISFVIFFSPYSRLNAGRTRGNFGSINGQKVTEEAYFNAKREVYLQFLFRNGDWPGPDAKKMGFDEDRETYYWLLLIQKQEDLGIRISSETAALVAREMLQSFHKGNVNSAEFLRQVLQPRGFSAADLERFMQHYLGVQELIATVAMSGRLVTPQEGLELYQRDHRELSTEAVWFTASNYLASVTATPEMVSLFYSNRLANYRLPERVQVSYVAFPLTNYLPAVEAELKTNLAEIVDLNYRQLGTNAYKGAKSPDEIKAKLREDILRRQAAVEAKRKAAAFATELDSENAPLNALVTLATTNGLTVKVTPPFDREEGPTDLQVEPNFVSEAFKLDPTNKPIAGPFVGENAAYLIAFNRLFESEIPPLASIQDQVTADCKHAQALALARQAGMAFYPALTNGIAQGKSFSALCVASKFNPVMLPPFSLSTRSLPEAEEHMTLNGPGGLKELAFGTSPGQVSRFQDTGDGGVILYVKFKLPLDEAKVKADLPNYLRYVRQVRQNEVFNDWFRHEAERGLRDTPLARAQPPTPNLGARSGKKS